MWISVIEKPISNGLLDHWAKLCQRWSVGFNLITQRWLESWIPLRYPWYKLGPGRFCFSSMTCEESCNLTMNGSMDQWMGDVMPIFPEKNQPPSPAQPAQGSPSRVLCFPRRDQLLEKVTWSDTIGITKPWYTRGPHCKGSRSPSSDIPQDSKFWCVWSSKVHSVSWWGLGLWIISKVRGVHGRYLREIRLRFTGFWS